MEELGAQNRRQQSDPLPGQLAIEVPAKRRNCKFPHVAVEKPDQGLVPADIHLRGSPGPRTTSKKHTK